MEDLLAEVKFSPNNFEIIKQGNHVVCAVSKKKNTTRQIVLLEC